MGSTKELISMLKKLTEQDGKAEEPTTGKGEIQPVISQEEAEYVDMENVVPRCGNCVNFIAPAACREVQGTISVTGICKLYKYDETKDQLGAGAIPIGTDIK